MIKKIFLILGGFVCLAGSSMVFADISGGVNLQGSINSGSTYQSSLSGIAVNSDIIYKFRVLTNGTNVNTGYIYFNQQSTNWWLGASNTCPTVSVSNFTDSLAKFTFRNNVAAFCVTEIYFKYKATQTGTRDFSYNVYYPTGSTNGNFVLRVNNSISIVNAYTLDANSNGYIDGYALRFSNSFASNLFDISKLGVQHQGVSASSLSQGTSYTSGGNYYINAIFADNIWNGGIRPEVSLVGFTNGAATFSTLSQSAQVEIDNARPILSTINGYPADSSSININSNDNLVLRFSESMRPSSVTGGISILDASSNPIAGTWSVNSNQDEFTFAPNVAFAGNISLSLASSAKDWSNNGGNAIVSSLINLNVTDSTAPTGESIGTNTGISINAGIASTNSRYVNLALKASDNYGVFQMMISNDSGFAGGAWQTYSESLNNWQLTAGDGAKTVYVKYKDAAGNVSVTYSDSINLATSPNYINLSSSIATYVTGTTLSLAGGCSYDDPSATLMLEYSLNSGAYQDLVNCNNLAGNKSWSANLGGYPTNATNTVVIRFKAHTSVSMSFSFIHDNANPTGTISINSAATYSNDRVVSLALNGVDSSGIKRIYLTGDIDLSYRGYQSYTTTKAVQLTSGDGTKTVRIQYEDNAGNLSSVYTDSIILDTTLPTGTISINAGASYTNSLSATLGISASDTNGIVQMMVSQDSNFVGASWEAYATSKSITLNSGDGNKIVYIKFKDNAGNISLAINDSILYDITDPSSSVAPVAGSYENNSNVSVTLTCNDAGSGCYRTYYRIGGGAYSQYTAPFDVTGNGTSVTVNYYSVDNAGNTESANSVTYTFGSSYLNIGSTVPTYASGSSITFTGGCANVAGNSDIEYKINTGAYTGTISCSSNLWSKTITYLPNVSNIITFRLKNNTSKTASATIIHDNIAPTGISVSINSAAIYSTSRTVSLTIAGTDANTLSKVYITGDVDVNTLTGYSNTLTTLLSLGDGTKTVRLKIKDIAGNRSSVATDSIILDTTLPNISVNPGSGTYSSARTITISLNEAGSIYYSNVNYVDMEANGTLYIAPIIISNSTTLYVQGKDTAGNKTLKYSYTYNIGTTDSGSNGGSGGGGGGGGYNPYIRNQTITKTQTTTDKTPTLTGNDSTNTDFIEQIVNDSTVVIQVPKVLTGQVAKVVDNFTSQLDTKLEQKRLTGRDLDNAIKKYNELIDSLKTQTGNQQDIVSNFIKQYNELINSYTDIIPSQDFEYKEFEYTLAFLKNNGLTKYNSVDEYKPFEPITREQAAKFFSQFAINVLGKTPDTNKVCEFNDLDGVDETLAPYIIQSCQLGLFKGIDGKFEPFRVMKKSEAITVLIRAIVGILDESGEIWYENYFNKAIELGFIKDKDAITGELVKPQDIDRALSRYEAGLLLYRSQK